MSFCKFGVISIAAIIRRTWFGSIGEKPLVTKCR